MATLTAQNGAIPMTVADVQGVDIAGLTFDAGSVNSPTLLRVGSGQQKGGKHVGHRREPDGLAGRLLPHRRTGLFVEHCQKYNVIWNGERGRTVSSRTNCPTTPRTKRRGSTTA